MSTNLRESQLDGLNTFDVVVTPEPAKNNPAEPPTTMLMPEIQDFELEDQPPIITQQPTDELEWNSEIQTEKSILEDSWGAEPDSRTEIPLENQSENQPATWPSDSRQRVKALQASTSKTEPESVLAENVPSNPVKLADEAPVQESPGTALHGSVLTDTELPEIELHGSASATTEPTAAKLPAPQEDRPATIVLKARPVDRHVVNDRRIENENLLPRDTAIADRDCFEPVQLRPDETIQFLNLPQLDRTQPAPRLDFPGDEVTDPSSSDELPVPLNVESPMDPLAKSTGYQAVVDQLETRQLPATKTVLQARPPVDALTNNLIQNRWKISKQPYYRTAILRLRATTVPDQNSPRASIANFDLNAPRIVRDHYPDGPAPNSGAGLHNIQQPVRPVLKAKTQLQDKPQLQAKMQLKTQSKTKLKTIER